MKFDKPDIEEYESPLKLWKDTHQYLKSLNILYVDKYIPYILCSIGAHVANLRNKKYEGVGNLFYGVSGSVPDLRLHLLTIAPPGFCLEEKTPILTEFGYKSADEINIGDLIYTENGTLGKIINLWKNKKECLEIKTTFPIKELICSKDHLILTKRGWLPAGSLQRYDKLCLSPKTEINEITKWTDTQIKLTAIWIAEGRYEHKETRLKKYRLKSPKNVYRPYIAAKSDFIINTLKEIAQEYNLNLVGPHHSEWRFSIKDYTKNNGKLINPIT
ncbi:MAG: hypothetical protein AABY22_08595, partial [Nanoarchaeota archaeon]